MNTRSYIEAALIAGVVIGLLGNLPLLNLINCFLCLWVWAGGALSVYLYSQFEGGELGVSPGQGAGLGALSGLIGAFVGVVVYALTSFISMPLFAGIARMLEIEGDLSSLTGGLASMVVSTFVFFLINVVLYPFFGAISGLITASLLGKQRQALDAAERM